MLRNRLIYAAVLVGSAAFYAFYDQWFSGFLLMLVLILPFFSLLCSLPAWRSFRLQLWAPEAVQQGEPAVLLMEPGCAAPLPRLRLRLWVSHGYAGDEERKQAPAVPLPTNHCGLLTITAEKPRLYDYLGLFSRPVRNLPTLRTLVRPLPEMPEELPSLARLQAPNLVPKPLGTFSEIHELRTYRPGDSLRTIHWKASAKTEELVVREPMEPASAALVLTVDLTGTPAELDSKLGRLLWMSTWLLEHELTHEIRALTGDGILCGRVSTPEERDGAVDRVLSAPAAESGSLENTLPGGAWHYHIS